MSDEEREIYDFINNLDKESLQINCIKIDDNQVVTVDGNEIEIVTAQRAVFRV